MRKMELVRELLYIFWKRPPREVAPAPAGLDMCEREPGWAVSEPLRVPHLEVLTPDCPRSTWNRPVLCVDEGGPFCRTGFVAPCLVCGWLS